MGVGLRLLCLMVIAQITGNESNGFIAPEYVIGQLVAVTRFTNARNNICAALIK